MNSTFVAVASITQSSTLRQVIIRPVALLLLALPLKACAQTKKATQAAVPESGPAGNSPMSCRIEGRIVSYIKQAGAKRGSVCASHPCAARVQILAVGTCGSSVTVPLNAGDTVAIRFACTLHPTAKIFPAMKERLPGLKPGNVFSANAQARIAMGTGGEFVVYSYIRK